MNTANLTQLVQNICAGTYCQSELVQFINLAQKISLSYLKFQEILGKRISGERLETDIELEDLALDCIAELFSRDDDLSFPQLKKYYEAKFEEQPDITDPDVLILTRRLVVRNGRAEIVRNIKVAVRNSEKLFLFKDMGRDYVFQSNGHLYDELDPRQNVALSVYLRRTSPPMPDDLLTSTFIDVYDPNKSVSAMIKDLFECVQDLTDYQNYLSLDSIVKLVRNVKFEVFKERLIFEEVIPTPQDHLESKEIESYIDVVMQSVETKISCQYITTGKLDSEKADIYKRALRDVLFDLIQKKDNSSYFRNLKYYIPELTQQEYRQEERSVFEYLAKVAKREFRKHLKELL